MFKRFNLMFSYFPRETTAFLKTHPTETKASLFMITTYGIPFNKPDENPTARILAATAINTRSVSEIILNCIIVSLKDHHSLNEIGSVQADAEVCQR